MDNIIAALERTDRVFLIEHSDVSSSDMEIILAAMQKPFPKLENMWFWVNDETVLAIPDSFLGGSAPRLEHFSLSRIPFPGLPKLLLSATQLVNLHLDYIPHSGYISPDAMATALSTLTRLIQFQLGFISTRSCPDRETRRPPPSTRYVLPVLRHFYFNGVSEYSEDLVARIDAPQLNCFEISFSNDIVIDTSQLFQFINRTPKLKALDTAHINILKLFARVKFSSQALRDWRTLVVVDVLCKGLDWQLSSLEQVCTSCLPPHSMLENLYFYEIPRAELAVWMYNIDNGRWLDLFRSFSAVKNLYLSEKAASCIAPALQEVAEGRTAEVLPTVLPALQNIFLKWLDMESSGPVQEGIGQFVAARQVVGHSIAVSCWTNYSSGL